MFLKLTLWEYGLQSPLNEEKCVAIRCQCVENTDVGIKFLIIFQKKNLNLTLGLNPRALAL